MRTVLARTLQFLLVLAISSTLHRPSRLVAEEEEEIEQPPLSVPVAGTVSDVVPIKPEATAVIQFEELARQRGLLGETEVARDPSRIWMPPEHEGPPEPYFPPALESPKGPPPLGPMAASPSPSSTFMGLDDVPMADSSYVVIPPDVGAAVGPTRILEGFNNNYRIRDKATGATLATLGTATFWAPVVALAERLALTDPRTHYDPYNNRFIVAMQTVTPGAGKILVGVSQTSDPSGAWNLYSFNSGATIDFPNVGFNKKWISVAINRYSQIGQFQRGINLVVDYPAARAGTGTGTLFDHANGTHFASAPALTYSATAETLYVVTHLSSTGATYHVDTITGTAAAPVYTTGGALTRTGGGWVQPSGNLLPQSAPNFGTSVCGATPCRIEAQDAQIRSAPVFRNGVIYYAQTVGLPAGTLTHTGVQWTKIATPTGTFLEGGRLEDPTATSTNGGKWYAYPTIAVNSVGAFILGYTQFSSAQHPTGGYSVHLGTDAPGTLRDPFIYHAGEDYYHKTFTTVTGRNRWGDFSGAQVDPTDDTMLWTLQQYAKTRVGTDDGNGGSNSSRWSSWWAGVNPDTSPPTCGVLSPSDGDSLDVSSSTLLAWTTSDNDTVSCVDLLLSRAGAGGPFDTLAACIPDSGDFEWTVTGPPTMNAIFRLVAHDASGNTCSDDSEVFSIVSPPTGIAEERIGEFALLATSTNPVQGSANLLLVMPEPGRVRIVVYDVSGREVAVLADQEYGPGRHPITWNMSDASHRAPAGLYFVRARGLGKDLVQRVTVTH